MYQLGIFFILVKLLWNRSKTSFHLIKNTKYFATNWSCIFLVCFMKITSPTLTVKLNFEAIDVIQRILKSYTEWQTSMFVSNSDRTVWDFHTSFLFNNLLIIYSWLSEPTLRQKGCKFFSERWLTCRFSIWRVINCLKSGRIRLYSITPLVM